MFLIRNNLFTCLLLGTLMLTTNFAVAQTCNGSLGDPVLNNDFGRGSSTHGPPLINSTNYRFFSSGTPGDGGYTIAKNTFGMIVGNWHQIRNHTPNDPDGYMMIINANNDPGVFYEAEVPVELCPNTTYEFAAWVINLLTYSANKPNLTFSILTLNDQLLAPPYNTGDIMEGGPTDWKQHGFLFRTTGNVNRVKIKITNNGPGGNGNDIALDDITFRACGPKITASIENNNQTTQNMCEGESKDYKFLVEVEGSPTLQYQWQLNDGSGWKDIPNETGKQMTVRFVQANKGIYQYRFTAAEPENFGSPMCRTLSLPLTIKVNPLPVPVLPANSTVCLGERISLNLTGTTNARYNWTGPNNFSSTEQSPFIDGATNEMQGIYKVTVTSDAGCEANAQTEVTVLSRPVVVLTPVSPVCKGSSVGLNASGGLSYRWLPTTGLSASDVPNPIASPQETTIYTVFVSNGACETSGEIKVEVIKELFAMAGADHKIIKGNSTVLKGQALGENISQVFWTPSDYLDDPSKLNPVASPPVSMTYTLNVISSSGCTSSTDDVFVKVYEKLVIPNTFSPNGDGINDMWNVVAIDTYANPKVKVMNRYGQLVFEGSAQETSWNGKHKNEDVPVGVYYYIINLEPGLKPLTGSLMVIR